MAKIKISNLPAIASPSLTDAFPVVQAGVTYKETCTQLQTLLNASGTFVLTSFAGTQHITTGSLQIDAGTFTSGLSTGGQVGEFKAFPTTASKGFLSLKSAVNATGNFSTTLSNALAQAQSTVLTIPDVGAATGNFILSGAAGSATQHITLGGLQTDTGALQSGISTGGFVGLVKAFPTTANKGFIAIQAAVNATGDFGTTLSNAVAQNQATVLTIPDVGAATGAIVATGGALVSGNLIAASGTAGLAVDSGLVATNLTTVASVSITAAEFNGMYAAPKLLVAAPGANKLLVVDRVELIMTYVSAAYANGGVVAIQYDSTVHGAGVGASNSEAAADFFAAASTTFLFNGISGNTAGIIPFATSVNKGLYLSNLTGAFTTGDSTFVCKVHYHVVATA